ncbi:uncharacterized protein BO66DRAFT_131983 [Aspergillus aculeatinus CBS 121060]|uniref:Uncharacterized protein n=1 Tax=Aspergillus aculeatinus CBS 121060 TaxID=1448322 RepID=A0ACD1H3P4_9EURO|nr:hypothetical protein BO66DRAFT_131983 [Aspergillus aculeatinus CBS 121060]RAH68235.1 hypothetical protein BO66DRAFT_131983 [Aspergillus aculeatinus CBS 121060]
MVFLVVHPVFRLSSVHSLSLRLVALSRGEDGSPTDLSHGCITTRLQLPGRKRRKRRRGKRKKKHGHLENDIRQTNSFHCTASAHSSSYFISCLEKSLTTKLSAPGTSIFMHQCHNDKCIMVESHHHPFVFFFARQKVGDMSYL